MEKNAGHLSAVADTTEPIFAASQLIEYGSITEVTQANGPITTGDGVGGYS